MQARTSALIVSALLVFASFAAAQERFGSLSGRVTDQQDAAVPGATVVITSNESGATRAFVTNSEGRYSAPDLAPGRYSVRFELTGFAKAEWTDISVVLGRAFELNAQLKIGGVSEAISVTAQAAPLVDAKSTLIAHNVAAEEFDRLPKARSFQSIALTAPSVNSGEVEGGFQVNGASGAENVYTVDGISTTSVIYGSSRQNTVFEYLQEVQIKTSGISAEYGGALGGVISAVTKSGGDSFHGEAHYYFEGSALASSPVKRLVIDPVDDKTVTYAQDKKSPVKQQEFGGSLGGPIVRNHLFFYGSYSPRNEDKTNTYNFTAGGNGEVNRNIWKQQAFGKLSAASRRVNAHWSTLWTPTKADGTLSAYNGSGANSFVGAAASIAPQRTRGYEINQVNTSGTADVTLTNSSFLSVRGGMFHDRFTDTGIPDTTSYTYQTSTATLAGVLPPALLGGIGTLNTNRSQITAFDTTDRRTFNVDYNHLFSAGGLHTLRGGYSYSHVQNDIDSHYPGGYVNIFWDRNFAFGGVTTGRGTYGYYEVNDRVIKGKAGANTQGLYVQDQWAANDHLTLNLGLRAEHELVPTFRPEYLKNAFDFGWNEKLAPRLGAAYDVHGDGKVKVFGSFGRYYDITKYELPRGSFGSETWCIYYRGLDTLDLGSLSLTNKPGKDLWVNPGGCRDRRVPSFASSIDPDTKPMSQDSYSGGVEYQLGHSAVMTVHVIHNNLRETIEDIGYLTPQGDEGYIIGNPGVRAAAIQFSTGATPKGQAVPRPLRKYDALELGYDRRLADNWFFSANYTLSRLYGNYAGVASSDEITSPTTGVSSATAQQQAGSIARPGGNESRAWDLDELMWDARGNVGVNGRLATDRPHVVKLYGSYQFGKNTQVGAFFYGGSGTPVTTYLESTNTGGGVGTMVNGRGDLGRTPVVTRTDMLVTHQLPMAGSRKVRLELNILNVFNQKTARHIFNSVNRGAGVARQSSAADLSKVDLTKGFDYNALILKTPDGVNAYDPRYKQADIFQDGLTAFVTAKFAF